MPVITCSALNTRQFKYSPCTIINTPVKTLDHQGIILPASDHISGLEIISQTLFQLEHLAVNMLGYPNNSFVDICHGHTYPFDAESFLDDIDYLRILYRESCSLRDFVEYMAPTINLLRNRTKIIRCSSKFVAGWDAPTYELFLTDRILDALILLPSMAHEIQSYILNDQATIIDS